MSGECSKELIAGACKKYWGPSDVPFNLEDNYQQYSKNEKIGRMADWLSNQERKNQTKATAQNMPTSLYAYIHEDDDDTFTLVDTVKPQKTQFQKNRQKYAMSRIKRDKDRQQRQTAVRQQKSAQPRHRKPNASRQSYRFGDRRHYGSYWFRRPSVMVRDTWKLLEDFEFSQLSKLKVASLPNVSDIYTAGTVMAYDKSYDYVQTRKPKSLKNTKCVFPKVPTCEDPIIRANISKANVFASDSIITALMSCTRSVAPWDILIHRVSNILIFDKRNDSEIELMTVHETASDPPFDYYINFPSSLFLEATTVNQNYTQQCLLAGTAHDLANKNPFISPEDAHLTPSVGYKYRVFDLAEDIKVMVRCEFDAYMPTDKKQLCVKALLEWDPKASVFDWRSKLDTQSGSILATEIKNNSNKFAKWTSSALLVGESELKIGFVSRTNFANNKEHSIVGSMQVCPKDLASQIGLSMENAWGIINVIAKCCLALPEGKYVLLKDPQKPMLRLYNVPDSALCSNDDMDDEGEEENDAKNEEKDGDYFGFGDIY